MADDELPEKPMTGEEFETLREKLRAEKAARRALLDELCAEWASRNVDTLEVEVIAFLAEKRDD